MPILIVICGLNECMQQLVSTQWVVAIIMYVEYFENCAFDRYC